MGCGVLIPPTVISQVEFSRGIQSLVERSLDRPLLTLVELLVIGSVVYMVLRFLQGTRGARLARAVGIILAVSFAVVHIVAEQFEFDRIRAIYPYFVLAVFLISLVAFQTELRRLLLRLGEADWVRWWSRGATSIIDPIVTAAERLSKGRIGALIAIERSTEVGALIESGVALDAIVSSELLETIFWPGAPLHDLGVIIRETRIVAAGCQFPLTESGEVDRALGSRHRAAIGMSQESDAVVVVVSEETGTISLAVHGKLHRPLTPEDLREKLREELIGRAAAAPRPVEEAPEPAPVERVPAAEGAAAHGSTQAA